MLMKGELLGNIYFQGDYYWKVNVDYLVLMAGYAVFLE
jgi:hypothetical protein